MPVEHRAEMLGQYHELLREFWRSGDHNNILNCFEGSPAPIPTRFRIKRRAVRKHTNAPYPADFKCATSHRTLTRSPEHLACLDQLPLFLHFSPFIHSDP